MFRQIFGPIWRRIPSRARLRLIRATQDKFTASAAAIIVNDAREVLLLEHALRPDRGWGIPGGFLERGEQPEQAVRRELIEEIALELEDVELFHVRVLNRHIEFLFRAEAVREPEIKSGEINAIGWFAVDNLPEQMPPSQKAIIKKVLSEEV